MLTDLTEPAETLGETATTARLKHVLRTTEFKTLCWVLNL